MSPSAPSSLFRFKSTGGVEIARMDGSEGSGRVFGWSEKVLNSSDPAENNFETLIVDDTS